MLVSTEHKVLVLPHRLDAANIIPSARVVTHRGEKKLVVPHRLEECRLLMNLGISVPHPIEFQYQWGGTTPFASQVDTAKMLTANRRAYVLSSMGVGKTRAALFAFDFLRQVGLAKKALVIAPLSTLNPVWRREIFDVFEGMDVQVLHGSRAKRQQMVKEEAHVYIINHDGVGVIQKELLELSPEVVIIDELAAYRNKSTKRWKDLFPIVQKAKYAWGLTGSPTPNEPTDAYGQVRLLTPEKANFSFRAFKQATMRQVSTFRWIERPEANDVVYRTMQPAIRFALDECHDLPPVTFSTRQVDMSPQQRKAYKQMWDTYAAQVADKTLTAANEAVKAGKLLQIGCGFIYDEDGKPAYIGCNSRLKVLLELIEEAEAKVIVFAPFTAAVRLLEVVLKKRGISCARIDGTVSKNERDEIFAQFRGSRDPRVLVAHPGTMAHGLTLTEASTIVWFSPTYSAETWEQANARIHRPGQTRHTHIVRIESTPVERSIYKRLKKRGRMQGVLLDMFKADKGDE